MDLMRWAGEGPTRRRIAAPRLATAHKDVLDRLSAAAAMQALASSSVRPAAAFRPAVQPRQRQVSTPKASERGGSGAALGAGLVEPSCRAAGPRIATSVPSCMAARGGAAGRRCCRQPGLPPRLLLLPLPAAALPLTPVRSCLLFVCFTRWRPWPRRASTPSGTATPR